MLSLSALCEEIAIELNGTRAGISLKTDLAHSPSATNPFKILLARGILSFATQK